MPDLFYHVVYVEVEGTTFISSDSMIIRSSSSLSNVDIKDFIKDKLNKPDSAIVLPLVLELSEDEYIRRGGEKVAPCISRPKNH